jgi:5-methylcytosine-specific restriction protein A
MPQAARSIRNCGNSPRKESRPNFRQRWGGLYSAAWDKARLLWLARHPLCVVCQAEDRITAASVVDHIIPHRGDPVLFWDSEKNWQSLCRSHHSKKTGRGE